LRCYLLHNLVAGGCELRRTLSYCFLMIIGAVSIASIFIAHFWRIVRIILFGILLNALCIMLALSIAIKKFTVIFRMTKIVNAMLAGNPWSIIISILVYLTIFILGAYKILQGIMLLQEHNEVIKKQNVDMNTCDFGDLTIGGQRLVASYVGGTVIANNHAYCTTATCHLYHHIYPGNYPGYRLIHGDVVFRQPQKVETLETESRTCDEAGMNRHDITDDSDDSDIIDDVNRGLKR